MNTLTLRLMIVAVVAPVMAAAAQVSPSKPAKPAPPPERVERPDVRVAPIPRPELPPLPPDMPDVMDLSFELAPLMDIHLDDMSLHQMEMLAHEAEMHASELAHIDFERMSMDAADVQMHAMELAQHAMDVPLDIGPIDVGPIGFGPVSVGPVEIGPIGPMTIWNADRLLNRHPRAPWAQSDPADSLYRLAREALNRGEYRRSAQLFNELTTRFPKSQYAQDSGYWEAFSRYRLGSTEELKLALKILDGIHIDTVMRTGRDRIPRETFMDIPALRARVQGALAARGDKNAEESLKREAAQNGGCDREAISVRAEALSALGQMDAQAAMPAAKKVLANRDECTVELRRRALYMLGRQGDADAAAIILDVAKNDTDDGIRNEAMRWLPRVAGDKAIPQLEELLRTSKDEQSQRSAVYALASIDTDAARKAVRALIERADVSEKVRYEAILSLTREKEGRSVSADDVNYLRSLYTKLESPRLREAVVTAVSRVETPETIQLLLGIARNENETSSLRATAISRLGRMDSVALDDIAKLYDVADSRAMREQILYAFYQRKEPAATDKIIEIARRDTDPQIRQRAISLLARRNDERAKEWIKRLVENP